jgi:pimeloyl-ACP methyl ester carboxylesterase
VIRHDLVIHGSRFEAAWTGPKPHEAPTIVLLHEGLGSVALWRGFPEKLAERTGLGVFAYSRLGYGGSGPAPLPRPLNYLDDEAALLPAVLDAAGIRAFILLGHSDGGSIAAVYAGLHADDRLSGVVLIAPHVIIEDLTVAGIRATAAAFQHGDLRARLARYHGTNTDIAFAGWHDLQTDPRFLTWNARSALKRLTAPVLIIQGDADPYGSLEQVCVLQEDAPQAEALVLPGCGHAPHLERQEAVLDAIADFAAGRGSSGARPEAHHP